MNKEYKQQTLWIEEKSEEIEGNNNISSVSSKRVPILFRNTIPVDDIIIEHLKEFGWKHEVTFIDKIVSRVMFESDTNPASGEKDSRIKTEHLIVLKRK